MRLLQLLTDGEHAAQLVDGPRRYDLVLRPPDGARTPQGALKHLDRHPGRATAALQHRPDRAGRRPQPDWPRGGRRRIVVYANTDGSDMAHLVEDVQAEVARLALPPGYFVNLEGQFQAQQSATRLIAGLSVVSLVGVFAVLYTRYRSGLWCCW